jgi:hypothetical protein
MVACGERTSSCDLLLLLKMAWEERKGGVSAAEFLKCKEMSWRYSLACKVRFESSGLGTHNSR